MKLIQTSFYILALFTLLGCGPSAEEKNQQNAQVLSEQIPGTWQITYMSVKIETYQSVGKDSLFEARDYDSRVSKLVTFSIVKSGSFSF